MIPPNTVILAGYKEHINRARLWLREQGLTKDDVKFVATGDTIQVITKRGIG